MNYHAYLKIITQIIVEIENQRKLIINKTYLKLFIDKIFDIKACFIFWILNQRKFNEIFQKVSKHQDPQFW